MNESRVCPTRKLRRVSLVRMSEPNSVLPLMNQDDWAAILDGHPIFDIQKTHDSDAEERLELSTNSLKQSIGDGPRFSGRHQVMALKDADLIVAVGSEIRITSLGDTRLGKSTKAYKVWQTRSLGVLSTLTLYQILHTPNVEFDIHQIAPNPSGKLLAISGAYQVAVVVLPRAGYSKLVSTSIDCK